PGPWRRVLATTSRLPSVADVSRTRRGRHASRRAAERRDRTMSDPRDGVVAKESLTQLGTESRRHEAAGLDRLIEAGVQAILACRIQWSLTGDSRDPVLAWRALDCLVDAERTSEVAEELAALARAVGGPGPGVPGMERAAALRLAMDS